MIGTLIRLVQLCRLGVRFSRGRGYFGLVRLGLVAVASVLLSILVLGAFTIHSVSQEHLERESAQSSVPAASGQPKLKVWDNYVSWDQDRIHLVLIPTPTKEGAPHPPGVEALPKRGEAVLSPALEQLVRREPKLHRAFDSYHHVETIASRGLVSPDQLLAYIGVDEGRMRFGEGGLSGVASIGDFGNPDYRQDTVAVQARTLSVLGLLALLGLPGFALMGASTRLAARIRERRLLALRVLGASAREARLAAAVEAMLVAVAGAVAGVVIFVMVKPYVSYLPIADASFFSDDARTPLWAYPVVVLVMGVLALVSGVTCGGRVSSLPASTRPTLEVRTRRRWPLVLLVAGVILLAVAPWAAATVSGPGLLVALVGGQVFLAVGLVFGLPSLVQGFGQWVGSRASGVAGLLAGRRLAADPGSALRLTSGICVAILALGLALPMRAVLSGNSGNEGPAGGSVTLLKVSDVTVDSAKARLVNAPGVEVALPQVQIEHGDHSVVSGVVASCQRLRRLAGSHVENCHNTVAMLNRPGRTGRWSLGGAKGEGMVIPAPESTVSVDLPGPVYDYPELIVPPDLPGLRSGDVSYSGFVMAVDRHTDAVSTVTGAALALSPAANIYRIGSASSNSTLAPFARWMTLGIVLAAGLGIFALALTAIDDSYGRQTERHRLRVLGANGYVVRGSMLLSQIIPMAFALTVAAAGAILSALSYAQLDSRGDVGGGSFLLLLGSAWGISAFVAFVTLPLFRGDRVALRTE